MIERNELLTALHDLQHRMHRGMMPPRPRGLDFMGPGPQVPPDRMGPGCGMMMPPERPMDITFSRRRMLSVLSEKEECSASELAEILDIRPSSVTQMLNKLEDHGLIQRHRDPRDGRGTLVTLTAEGREAFARRRSQAAAREKAFGANLSEEEKAEFIRLCRKIEAGLADAPQPEAPEDDEA